MAAVLFNLISFDLISCMYVKLIIYSVKSKRDWNFFEKIVVNLPQFFVIVSSFPLAYKKAYTFTPETFHDTTINYLFYAIAAFNIIFGFIYAVKNRNAIGKQRSMLICLFSAVIIVIVLIYIFTGILILNFGTSLALIIIMLTIQDPNAMIDISSDSLNSKAFDLLTKEWLSSKSKFSVSGIAIRNLGFINEKYGTEVASRVIERTVHLLRDIIKEKYIFRFHESSFTILSDNIEEKRLSELLEKLSEGILVHGMSIRLDAGAFVVLYPQNFKTESQLYSIIDFMIRDLYKNPETKILFADEDLLNALRFEEEVSVAIKNAVHDKSFMVYFQPILNQKTGKFDTAEALARLATKELGFVPPDSFISKAEQSGEIIEIGKIVLDKVCHFISANKIEKYGVKNIKVNLSVVQCMQNGMSRDFISIIDSYGINHDMINFEITESATDNAGIFSSQNLSELRSAGFKFSLDDYGTGYSNMTRMISFHFDVLKFDKSIVWMAETKKEAMISLEGTVKIANGIDMAVLAEGVETENQANLLRNAGVHYFQGYMYSKPIPEDDYLKFLKEKSAASK